MNNENLYDIIYALAACDGREDVLFGETAPAAHEAFKQGLVIGAPFPELWFELPLQGKAWFDLHMLTSRADVATQAKYAGLSGIYANVLAWFAESSDTRQLALSFDTSKGIATLPAVQLLLNRSSLSATTGFLEAAGRPELTHSYETFIRAMPQGWYACYTGLFPARESEADDSWLRVECLVGDENQRLYAQDAGLLRSHLGQLGLYGASEQFIEVVQELARSPFPLELQFNVGRDGRALPVLSASVRFQTQEWACPGASREVQSLFQWVQDMGLADNRWKELAGTAFSKRIVRADEEAQMYCYPAFIKIRWRQNLPMDAKAYLIAGSLPV